MSGLKLCLDVISACNDYLFLLTQIKFDIVKLCYK